MQTFIVVLVLFLVIFAGLAFSLRRAKKDSTGHGCCGSGKSCGCRPHQKS